MADDVMTTQEAANYLKITQRSVNGLINRGRLKARKIGIQWLIFRESVEQYKAEKDRQKSK